MKTRASLVVEYLGQPEVTKEMVLQTFNIVMQNGTIVGSNDAKIPGKCSFYSRLKGQITGSNDGNWRRFQFTACLT